ncbi:MAG: STAS domain-containing protein [Magnetospirillum sp.]|nr:STAS domain-containing protein [Magnetospirillum sp.]
MVKAPKAQLMLKGEQTIRTVAATLAELRKAFAGDGALVVDCSQVSAVDLCFVQLLLAARKSARARNKELWLRGVAAGPLPACLRAGGLLGGEPGPMDDSHQFWVNGGGA